MMARCHELLQGAIDLHTHSAPSFFERLVEADIRTMVAENPARPLGLD
jgi:hypothetical protein